MTIVKEWTATVWKCMEVYGSIVDDCDGNAIDSLLMDTPYVPIYLTIFSSVCHRVSRVQRFMEFLPLMGELL